ncbi:unnamed protein product [Owenia fusiformis]|uniref:Uncharacterized protein n=1 Tax=Owenia fusiformis TaxID=6347 RepID=A0A8J1XGY6_OWEFU|nr:unnamed protein product [Owenia fusiformis]
MNNMASGELSAVEVTVVSNLAQRAHQGEVKVVADPTQPVDTLISAFCTEKNIRQKYKYVIRTSRGEVLSNTMTIAGAYIQDQDVVTLGTKDQFNEKTYGCSNWHILAALCIFIGVVGLAAIIVIRQLEVQKPFDYGIVLDAGSSHTNLFIYKWEGSQNNGTAVVNQIYKCNIQKAISSFTTNITQAGDSLRPCLEKATRQIPTSKHSSTPIYLGATAGMRLLKESNSTISDGILSSVRQTIQSYPFKVSNSLSQVRIITGAEEGVFGWITVNFLFGSFGNFKPSVWLDLQPSQNAEETLGALDMGGASTQITFLHNHDASIPVEYAKKVRLYGHDYNLYSYSFLCYGIKEAVRRYRVNLLKAANFTDVIPDPCSHSGYKINISQSELFNSPCASNAIGGLIPVESRDKMFEFQGTGDSDQCAYLVNELINTTSCTFNHCSFNGKYLSPLFGNYKAFSGFYFSTFDLNLTYPFSLAKFRNVTTTFCKKSWPEVQKIPTPASFDLPVFCFNAHYVDTILTDGYNFTGSDWDRLVFANQVRGSDLGWSLGFMINATNAIPVDAPVERISLVVFILLTVLFALFLLCAVGFCCYAHSERKAMTKSKYRRIPNETSSPSHYGSLD